ncbi:MAG TPA: dihydroxyacetone kinase subunit DhaL [Ruminiclostridium sp.]
MEYFLSSKGGYIVHSCIKVIQNNKNYLSEVDGAIGDGDHGINMNKGFTICQERLTGGDQDLSSALKTLGRVLLMEIGGSMGPLYGTFFIEMSKVCACKENIDIIIFANMLGKATDGVSKIGSAKVGDKTLMDTLVPALEAYNQAIENNLTFERALTEMKAAAEIGKESTRDMVAMVGRASRLGERSRGFLDAGAVSCNLILSSIADAIVHILNK